MTMTLSELLLRAIAFGMICGIIGYILYVLIIWFLAVIQIGIWALAMGAGGVPGG
jgi:hypothetical protein